MNLLEDGFIDSCCSTETCSEYKIAKRYPTRLIYAKGNIIPQPIVYMTLAPQCCVCSSFMPVTDQQVKQILEGD